MHNITATSQLADGHTAAPLQLCVTVGNLIYALHVHMHVHMQGRQRQTKQAHWQHHRITGPMNDTTTVMFFVMSKALMRGVQLATSAEHSHSEEG